MNFIERKIAPALLRAFAANPTITLTGPRQAGKSTLLQKVFPDLPYVNLESISVRNLAMEDPDAFIEKYSNGAIFDEAQRVPEIFSSIQVLVDKRKKSSLFVISGSQNFLLLEQISQSLAGRTSIFHLAPLSFEELIQHRKTTSLNDAMFVGGYPRIHDMNLSANEWLDSYVQTFIERDVRSLKNVSNLEQFRLFVQMCAARSGQILDLTSLGNDCGISSNTAKSWLSLLETSFIIFTLRPYYRNYNKRLIKSPKIYFWDSGLLCYLLRIRNPEELSTHANRGHIFETYVISEIKKHLLNRQDNTPIYYWRDKVHEIDCLIEKAPGDFIPIEIKSGRNYTSDYKKSLDYLKKISSFQRPAYIIYAGSDSQRVGDNTFLLAFPKDFDFIE